MTIRELEDQQLLRLREVFGERVSTVKADLIAHGRDEGYPDTHAPQAVVYAESEADVVAALRLARELHVPITPYAAGSGLEGNAVPWRGGISLDLTRMNRVLLIESANFSATVEPGVLYPELSRQARPHGLFFAVDPGAEASLGGMAATGASGTAAVKYGTMRDNVLEMRVALLDGRVLRVGSRAPKSSAGYDLKHLFLGSEGTLGVITELTVRLWPLPASAASMQVSFASVDDAVTATVMIIGAGIGPQRLELVDAETIRAVNFYKGRSDAEQPTLWIEVIGRDGADVATQLALVEELCRESGGAVTGRATTEAQRTELWTARHHVYYALRAMYPGHSNRLGDVCVPIAALPGAIAITQQLLREHQLHAPIVGHVGDGNFHLLFHAAPEDAATWERIALVSDTITREALRMGGTCTGEHGVGIRKRKYLRDEHGEALDAMREIKSLFDPYGLLNPGKIFEE
ncbi:FAD-binding oxidoreductase [Deinococcus peraridilitoris]|uniref:D-lactate dehydrogenase (cytochrome) n=1 Tax=Deinococcus peraridilitoris (strain DSM 19664 / LMG 22246 / CIP 109416 / KR-200) TaxID=937777 RepID=L0A4S2_DEIPD|nr:FAD-binding oxidoreductase [Deinococcus peraridilitoris]AFZ68883.1 FAD/FMN-dependent dehydrogenase [Deinococcus peraridilitoris DSM 19664]